MKRLFAIPAVLFAISILFSPATAFALPGLPGSFGGRITKIEPCTFPPGSLLVSLISSRTETFGKPQDYLYTPPFTLVQSPLMPIPLPGGQALGFADAPVVCQSLVRTVLWFSIFSFVPATRMTFVGFSPPAPPGMTDAPSV
ncbi:MAG TPA: hypothetical protein VHD55_02165 [Candidatus Paceibacterota bacterium]|nr:hypothetical protein [Candidatus Paceibacterota bacterium]